MVNITNLPIEVLRLILEDVPRPTQYQCLVVSKLISEAAFHTYFHHFVITYRVARSLNSMINTNDRVLNTRRRQEVFTRTRITRTLVLDCSRLARQDLDTALILALLCNIFINIRKLVYDYVDYRYHNDYLIYLSMNPITNCPRLKYISAARHILDNRFERRHSFRLYFDICLRFSSNITDLYLPCFNLLELDPVAIVFLLHNFSSLKNLFWVMEQELLVTLL